MAAGAGGRPRKPSNLHALHGTDRKDRRNVTEPTPPPGRVTPPSWLGAEALAAWHELAPTLTDMGLLTTADPHALALLCDVYARYISASAVITEQGPTYESVNIKTGVVMVRKRPEVDIAADCWRRLNVMLQQFGMTPSSRGRVQLPQKARVEDPSEEFFSGRRATG